MAFDYFTYIIIPLLIFLARIADVSIGTLRIIFLSKGYRFLAAGTYAGVVIKQKDFSERNLTYRNGYLILMKSQPALF